MLPGPFKNPAKETDPRCLLDLFYYHQQDLLESRVARAGCQWRWSSSRPHAVVGFSLGSAMNIVMSIAVYAAVSKELGIPLHFPGTQATFDAVYQMTDSTLLARGIEFLSTQPQVTVTVYHPLVCCFWSVSLEASLRRESHRCCSVPIKRSTSPTATSSAGATCGPASQPSSAWSAAWCAP